MKTISVVTPCFNEEQSIRDAYDAVRDIFKGMPSYQREHIFCDNASTDRTLSILREIAAQDPCVKVIVNTRNFGPLRNSYNGVMASAGDAVLLFLPADLQDPPELLPQFVELWERGYEIVYGIRARREEAWVTRFTRGVYYRLLTNFFSEVDVPPGVGDFQLVDRRVVEAMRHVRDGYPFMRMMTFECGGRSIGIPYTWRARKKGISKNGLTTLFDQGMNGLVSFTTAPVRVALFGGFLLISLSLFYALANLFIGLIFYRQLTEPGIMTIIVALFFLGGFQLFFLGMIGEYVLATYGQVRDKPVLFERERINFPPAPNAARGNWKQ
ncbi:glycosyltransferase family 2 protein [Bradyrhizobium sp. Pear76]|uniref:glycosyltransferase family 2 protein n=1 Tax=Bradyrhizobium oropedii TaxID=1571201 RepID=UPI001E44DC4A|nr:glycosyltransferase family 2 protein [Bradyrhizobium oropedii]MCC8964797.1 glycosyltransferase family 2 protein [Bradyrhizobium oropedii]